MIKPIISFQKQTDDRELLEKEEKMRKHILFSGLAAVVLLCLMVGPSFARAPNYRAQQDRPLTPKKAVLHMFETENDGSWQLTRRAARGKLTYQIKELGLE